MSAGEPYVLLAEDNADEAELMVRAFQAQRFPVPLKLVSDGAEAIDLLSRRGHYEAGVQGPPILVLLDIRMPRKDGLEVLRFMRGDRWLKYVPVVMFSGSADENARLSALDLGARFVIAKPADLEGYRGLAAKLDALLSFLR